MYRWMIKKDALYYAKITYGDMEIRDMDIVLYREWCFNGSGFSFAKGLWYQEYGSLEGYRENEKMEGK